MEIVEMFTSREIVCPNPTVLFVGVFIAGPLDVIPKLDSISPIQLRVNDLLDLKVFSVAVYFNRRRRWFST